MEKSVAENAVGFSYEKFFAFYFLDNKNQLKSHFLVVLTKYYVCCLFAALLGVFQLF